MAKSSQGLVAYSMPAIFRQKACIACASSKRRCDKQLPECRRCLDRDEECIYPQRKTRLRTSNIRDNGLEKLSTVQSYDEVQDFREDGVQAPGVPLDFALWDPVDSVKTGVSVSEGGMADDPSSSADTSGLLSDAAFDYSGRTFDLLLPWFLQEQTWTMQYSGHEPDCETDIDLPLFIRTVEEMLQYWVRNGYNSFIHRRLYQKGMPTCIQDAFTTFAAYATCTQAVKETILQITDERLSTIVHQYPPNTSDAQGILNHLARVQALFVYEFIGLFDGSPRLRASAEQQLPTLRSWVAQMWEAVKRYKGEDTAISHPTLPWMENDFDREYNTSSELWKVWILTESVRRTQFIINAVANTYQSMTMGWAQCTGAVMFTARHGLWEAESAMQWSNLSGTKSPLLVPSLQPGPLISQYPAEEFDDFVKTVWTFIIGAEKVQCWIDRSNHTTKLQPV